MNVTTKQRGFTLIEVILVLAIAALIFLMIFVALPALQASQRDTARKNDAGIVSSGVTKYTSSERESITTSTSPGDLQAYIDDLDQYEKTNVSIEDTSTGGATPTSNDPEEAEIFVYPSAECDGSDAVTTTNARKSAVRVQLENGTFYCVDAS